MITKTSIRRSLTSDANEWRLLSRLDDGAMVSYGTSVITLPFSLYESLSEAQFMPVRICNVEEALAPRRILLRIWL